MCTQFKKIKFSDNVTTKLKVANFIAYKVRFWGAFQRKRQIHCLICTQIGLLSMQLSFWLNWILRTSLQIQSIWWHQIDAYYKSRYWRILISKLEIPIQHPSLNCRLWNLRYILIYFSWFRIVSVSCQNLRSTKFNFISKLPSNANAHLQSLLNSSEIRI